MIMSHWPIDALSLRHHGTRPKWVQNKSVLYRLVGLSSSGQRPPPPDPACRPRRAAHGLCQRRRNDRTLRAWRVCTCDAPSTWPSSSPAQPINQWSTKVLHAGGHRGRPHQPARHSWNILPKANRNVQGRRWIRGPKTWTIQWDTRDHARPRRRYPAQALSAPLPLCGCGASDVSQKILDFFLASLRLAGEQYVTHEKLILGRYFRVIVGRGGAHRGSMGWRRQGGPDD